MKLGVFTAILDHQPLETALDYLQGLGVQAVELGCGGTAGHSHANPEILFPVKVGFSEAPDSRKPWIFRLRTQGTSTVHSQSRF